MINHGERIAILRFPDLTKDAWTTTRIEKLIAREARHHPGNLWDVDVTRRTKRQMMVAEERMGSRRDGVYEMKLEDVRTGEGDRRHDIFAVQHEVGDVETQLQR